MKRKPAFFDILSDEEKREYEDLQRSIGDVCSSRPQAAFPETFGTVIDRLKSFVLCGDRAAELRRALVCGIMWVHDVVAVNTRQLSITIGKCKSSINKSFTAFGYTLAPPDPLTVTSIAQSYPFMRTNLAQMRQWTLRTIPKAVAVFPVFADIEALFFPDLNPEF